jgi:hypothetical protein
MLVFFLHAAPAQAANRTWVSSTGDDANPCSRTTPCRTLAEALSKTSPRGEINILDSGGFGTVIITQSVSIVAPGVEAGILAQVDGIVIDTSANDSVTLRGLDIKGKLGSNDAAGIHFIGGNALYVQKCLISDFGGLGAHGILFTPRTSTGKLYVQDTLLSANFTGILIHPSDSGGAFVMLTRVQAEGNSSGILANTQPSFGSGITMTVRDSVVAGISSVGSSVGIGATTDPLVKGPSHPPIQITIDHSTIANYATGVSSIGLFSTVSISASTITGNATGVAGIGKLHIYTNNVIEGNGDDPMTGL